MRLNYAILAMFKRTFKIAVSAVFLMVLIFEGFYFYSSFLNRKDKTSNFLSSTALDTELNNNWYDLPKKIQNFQETVESKDDFDIYELDVYKNEQLLFRSDLNNDHYFIISKNVLILPGGDTIRTSLLINISSAVLRILKVFSIIILISTLTLLLFLNRFSSIITAALNPLSNLIDNFTNNENEELIKKTIEYEGIKIDEFENLKDKIIDYKKSRLENEELKIKSAVNEKIVELSKQVSHDIRSPLIALKLAIEETDTIPDSQRLLIHTSVQRISDIANNLLSSGKKPEKSSSMEIQLLAPLIDLLISEKRMQYRANNQIEILSDLSNSFGLFVNINSIELSRVFSNLINNSVEAITTAGKITVKLYELENKIILSISDNGLGMSESVLRRLGEAGFSHGKNGTESGSGLGIYHAKKTIESFGGSFEVESHIGAGTLIKVYLPKATAPKWFVTELFFNEELPIFILDDDDSIHKLWAERIKVELFHFTDGEQFEKAIMKMKGQNFLCLIDHELLGQSRSGLELIEVLQIQNHSILVTSHFDEKEIQKRALALGVRIIPKSFASSIPLKFQQKKTHPVYDYVYIDDDKVLRNGWERRAKKKNINLLTMPSSKDFSLHTSAINKKTTHIYIDSNLGEDEIRGEDFAKLIHAEGYEHIYISSGHLAEDFAHLPWLNYAGKDCPF